MNRILFFKWIEKTSLHIPLYVKNKWLVAFLLMISIICNSFAQEFFCVYRTGEDVLKYSIKNTESISFKESFDKYNYCKEMWMHQKDGEVIKIDISSLDSIRFVRKKISDKRGFVIIRVDDSQPSKEIIPMSKVLDKYGFKMVYCFNASNVNKDIIEGVLDYQSRGHEVTDHTPNHTTAYADLSNVKQARTLAGIGVRKIDGVRVYFDWDSPSLATKIVNNKYVTFTENTDVIEGDFSSIKISAPLIYSNEFGWVALKNITTSKATAVDPQTGEKKIFSEKSVEQMYVSDYYSFTVSVDGMKALMLASRMRFIDLGLKPPYVWCMCGGPWAMGKGSVIRDAGATFGYIVGSEHSYPTGNIPITYNQANPISRWATPLITVSTETKRADEVKRIIANDIAKHKVVIEMGHMSYKDPAVTTLFQGTNEEKFEQYLASLDQVLEFCYENDIQVLTYKDLVNTIYESQQDSLSNLFPPLYSDLTSQGFPDGYKLDTATTLIKSEGVENDHLHSLKRSGNGNLFMIESIGGLEKGKNVLTFYAKGTDNATVNVLITSENSEIKYSNATIKILGAKEDFVHHSTTIEIPPNLDLCTISVTISNNVGKDISISGMFLGKVKL